MFYIHLIICIILGLANTINVVVYPEDLSLVVLPDSFNELDCTIETPIDTAILEQAREKSVLEFISRMLRGLIVPDPSIKEFKSVLPLIWVKKSDLNIVKEWDVSECDSLLDVIKKLICNEIDCNKPLSFLPIYFGLPDNAQYDADIAVNNISIDKNNLFGVFNPNRNPWNIFKSRLQILIDSRFASWIYYLIDSPKPFENTYKVEGGVLEFDYSKLNTATIKQIALANFNGNSELTKQLTSSTFLRVLEWYLKDEKGAIDNERYSKILSAKPSQSLVELQEAAELIYCPKTWGDYLREYNEKSKTVSLLSLLSGKIWGNELHAFRSLEGYADMTGFDFLNLIEYKRLHTRTECCKPIVCFREDDLQPFIDYLHWVHHHIYQKKYNETPNISQAFKKLTDKVHTLLLKELIISDEVRKLDQDLLPHKFEHVHTKKGERAIDFDLQRLIKLIDPVEEAKYTTHYHDFVKHVATSIFPFMVKEDVKNITNGLPPAIRHIMYIVNSMPTHNCKHPLLLDLYNKGGIKCQLTRNDSYLLLSLSGVFREIKRMQQQRLDDIKLDLEKLIYMHVKQDYCTGNTSPLLPDTCSRGTIIAHSRGMIMGLEKLVDDKLGALPSGQSLRDTRAASLLMTGSLVNKCKQELDACASIVKIATRPSLKAMGYWFNRILFYHAITSFLYATALFLFTLCKFVHYLYSKNSSQQETHNVAPFYWLVLFAICGVLYLVYCYQYYQIY